MSVKLVRTSRLRFYELVTVDGVEHWNFTEMPTIEPQKDDLRHQVESGDRIDLLAYQFYGDPTLWFVIALANDLELLPVDLREGDKLRIPSPNYVRTQLFLKALSS